MTAVVPEGDKRARLVVAIFGSTGTAGSGAVQACLGEPVVSEVRAITRRSLGFSHRKLKEIICSDFNDLSAISSRLAGVDVCLFCLGISATKVPDENRYREIHVTYAVAAARTLATQSPNAAFVYLSGAGAKSNSRMMWARVKAEAESELLGLTMKRNVCVRPGVILPMRPTGASRWLVAPLLQIFPIGIGAKELGTAMLRVGLNPALTQDRTILENRDLREAAST